MDIENEEEFKWDEVVAADTITPTHKLSPDVLEILKKNGIDQLYPMQEVILEFISSTETDIAVRAPTGSGKTLSYTIPMFEYVNPLIQHVQVIVLTPTYPLAVQVANVIRPLMSTIKVSVKCFGEGSIDSENYCSSQIVVTTNFRLVSHLANKTLDLRWLSTVIYDETDKLLTHPLMHSMVEMLKPSFVPPHLLCVINDPEKSVIEPSGLGIPFRSMLFSATLSSSPRFFKILKMNRPMLLDFQSSFERKEDDQKYTLNKQITNIVTGISSMSRDVVLLALLKDTSKRYIVFCNSTVRAFLVFKLIRAMGEYFHLEKNKVQCCHGMMNPKKKVKLLQRFESKQVSIFVTTDTLSRGIDYKDVDMVINYDAPNTTALYVHRAGRCGRSQKAGCCHSLIYKEEEPTIKKSIYSSGGKPIFRPVDVPQDLKDAYKKAADEIENDKSVIEFTKNKK
ncbi:ATP-dependent RNA helicase DBP6, putative [Entamoeba invadens IP1]|uniref:ATP-dependent RNA helicase DBP6, putative n=1 Tax=Entamoeba invadens IP1 TaxID=370355 RepID=A0A0A1TZW9_ENTIV|nr:ATP-dependent RNA helicase DBP6, putative [Entamoeba invadens IP1]ELP87195.1 ATP-dependent RNA helicase DBP6, putative [Entamoeba invadens IP1]|eukprot:XP_004253966.1 ATP-dependent RNA helicase DBP6, putative [Entamoeba invadens IP1]